MMAAGRSLPAIRPARTGDASFIARNILASQRGPLPRGWFDIGFAFAEEKRDPAFGALAGSPAFRRFVRAI